MPRGYYLLCLAWLVVQPVWADRVMHLILSETGSAYQEASEAFRAGVGQRVMVKVWSLSELGVMQVQNLTRSTDLVVPVGVKAARFVAEHYDGQAPVLILMIPRATNDKLVWPASVGRRKVSAIFIDQPPGRSLDLIEAAFPRARRVGLLVSSDNTAVARGLSAEAARRNIKLNIELVDSENGVSPVLRRTLAENDVLLLVPDAIAINAGNVQNVLLTTYRFRVPVIGFSPGLSKAGAVASAFSTPAQIGAQGAQSALRFEDTGELPLPQHAGEFSIAFNTHVARSLGVILPNEAAVRRKLGAQAD